MFSAMVWTCPADTGSVTAAASPASLPQAESATASRAPRTIVVMRFIFAPSSTWASVSGSGRTAGRARWPARERTNGQGPGRRPVATVSASEGQHVQQPQPIQDGDHAQVEQDPGGDSLDAAAQAEVEQDRMNAGDAVPGHADQQQGLD